jgi:hypothetical protein
MKSNQELTSDILAITTKIQETHPELSKFINDMPMIESGPEGEEVNTESLSDYYHSLQTLLDNYHTTHNDGSGIGSKDKV